MADYIVFIHKGRIIFELTRDELAERFAVVKCGAGESGGVRGAHILGARKTRFDEELLVDNAPEVRAMNPGAVLEAASIDDIMTFFAKGAHSA